MTKRIRKSVYSLKGVKDDLSWYAAAVAEMRKRPFTDPRSWCYQAAVHGYGNPTAPYASCPGSKPPAKDQTLYWKQCQHQTWYFLPWHRGYLAYFEQIVGAEVTKLGGPADWALPYWNYSASEPSRHLPPAFLPDKVDGHANPLFSPGRALTKGKALPVAYVSLAALGVPVFAGDSVNPEFGGPKTGFSHFGGTNGRLESVPHNVVHVGVGGLMNNPDTAALDPIFWLHHANIDRLWMIWNAKGHKNPTDASWLTGIRFQLHDKDAKVVTFMPSNMIDPANILGGYTYDDLTPPASAAVVAAAPTRTIEMAAAEPRGPQLVGNSDAPTTLDKNETSVSVKIARPRAHAMTESLSGARPARVFLNLENVTGVQQSVVYEVFINAPPAKGAAANKDTDRLPAGLLSSFGVAAASQRDSHHGGAGITTAIEITSLVDQLRKEGRWDDTHLDVSFVKEEHGESTGKDAPLKIGRISVFYQ